MPTRAARPCAQPGCSALVLRGGYCEAHLRERPARYRPPDERQHYAWRKLRLEAIRDQPWCSACGEIEGLQLDHIVPLSRGGAMTRENVRVLCRRCNAVKGAALT